MNKIREIISELLMVFKGTTIDVLVPPILFYALNRFSSLLVAVVGSAFYAVIVLILRINKKENYYYSGFGFLLVMFAYGMILISSNTSNYILPDLIGTAFLIVATIVSIVVKRPIAAWLSHITRGWDLNWFRREDVSPAYFEVSYFWLMFFVIRFGLELSLYLNSSLDEIIFVNIILGLPVTLFVLTISYIYGMWRLKKLGGPGIDEFMKGVQPPYRGQTRGF